MTQNCGACRKRWGRECKVMLDIAYPFKRYGSCWASTSDPDWEEKIRSAVKKYKESHK